MVAERDRLCFACGGDLRLLLARATYNRSWKATDFLGYDIHSGILDEYWYIDLFQSDVRYCRLIPLMR
jgi:hypothetical protein